MCRRTGFLLCEDKKHICLNVLEKTSKQCLSVAPCCVTYLYNVLRAFLRDGCTQHRGRTDSRLGASCQQVCGVVLRTVSRKVPRLPGSGSSCSESSSPCGAPCPIQSGGNAPRSKAYSFARLPVFDMF